LACSNRIEIWSTLLIDLDILFIIWKVEAKIDDLDLNWKVKGEKRKYEGDLVKLNGRRDSRPSQARPFQSISHRPDPSKLS
jgi:hypothetical protein